MTHTPKKTLCVIVAAVLLVVMYCHQPARPEPVYQGKTLTQWLLRLDDGQAFGISSSQLSTPTAKQLEAARAIHEMGTNALPYLMEDIHARPTTNSYRVRLYHWFPNESRFVFHFLLFSTDLTGEDYTRWRAAQGLAALGPLAKPALPELNRLLMTNYWHSSIKEAAYALATIGPEGVEALTNAVQPKNDWPGMCAIWALGQHPAVGTNYIPFFIQCTTSKSEGTAEGAIEVLGLYHVDAALVIPTLTNALAAANPELRKRAAHSLGEFGHEAASVVPALQMMTNDAAAGREAVEALKQIQ